MISYQQWRDEIRPFLPSCPDITIDWAVRSAAIEFCDRTWIALHEMDPEPPQLAQASYSLDTPNELEAVGVFQVFFGNNQLLPRSQEQLNAHFGGYDPTTQTGTPRFFTRLADIDTITVLPAPDAAAIVTGDTLKIVLAVKPTRDSSQCPDLLWRNWMEEIAAGAKAKLMATPSQEYTDAKLAGLYRQQFVNALGKAKIERMRGQVATSLVARPRRFW